MDNTQTQTNTQNALDPQAVALAKAIRNTESGGDFTAKGGSGEYGAYQFMPKTWQTMSQKYLGQSINLNDATPEQQNEVAYKTIKDWKDQGLKPDQIASMWNSGKPDYEGNVGVNKAGVKFDTPQYVKTVYNAYTAYKNGQEPGQIDKTLSTVGNTQTVNGEVNKNQGIGEVLGNVVKSITEPVTTLLERPIQLAKNIYGNATAPSQTDLDTQKTRNNYLISVLQDPNASPYLKQKVSEEVGQTTKNVLQNSKNANTTIGENKAPETPSDIVKDLGRGLQTVGFGLGPIGGGIAMGSGSAIEQGGGVGQALLGGALGGATGGLLKGAGNVMGKLTQYLPERIARGFLPGINKETAQYAVNKGLGSPVKMLEESNTSIDSLVNDLGSKLTNHSDIKVNANDILPDIVKKFPNAGLTPETISQKLMQVAPNQKTLIEKLANGESLSLKELHQLNSNVGKNTFKTIFDDPAVKAGKDIASSFYHSASNFIKAKVPETETLFSQLSKEYPLNTALQKLIRSGDKAKLLTLKDIVALMAGFTGGPVGSLMALGIEKGLTNPTVNLKAAQALTSAGKLGTNKILQGGANLGSLLTSKGVGGLANQMIPPSGY